MNEKAAGGLKHIKSIFKRKKDKDGPSSSYQGDAGPAGAPPAQWQPESYASPSPSIPSPQLQRPIQLNEDYTTTAPRSEAQRPNAEPARRFSYEEEEETQPTNQVTKPIPHEEEPPPPPPPPKDDVSPLKPTTPPKHEDLRPKQSAPKEDEVEDKPSPFEDVSKQEQEAALREGVADTDSDDPDAVDEPGQTAKPKMSATSGPLEDIPAFIH